MHLKKKLKNNKRFRRIEFLENTLQIEELLKNEIEKQLYQVIESKKIELKLLKINENDEASLMFVEIGLIIAGPSSKLTVGPPVGFPLAPSVGLPFAPALGFLSVLNNLSRSNIPYTVPPFIRLFLFLFI